jgi:hypothetical protein
MDLQWLMSQMEANARTIRVLTAGCSDQQTRWKPDAGSWSILEVVNHLLDEEHEDFRPRIDVMLHPGEDIWFPIDPEGWVTRRRYNQRDLAPSLEAFMAARHESLAWLRGLDGADWSVSYDAPFGTIRAGDVLAAWVAHDVLHMRQLVELKWAYLVHMVEPYSVRYAGPW